MGLLKRWNELPYFWKAILGGFGLGFSTGLFPLLLALVSPIFRSIFSVESAKDNWKLAIGMIFVFGLLLLNGPALILMKWLFGSLGSSEAILLPFFQGAMFAIVAAVLAALNKMKVDSLAWKVVFWAVFVGVLVGYILLIGYSVLGGIAG